MSAREVHPETILGPGLSLRSNFAWSLTGNVVYAACQWGMIVALAKLGSSRMVGQFSLGIAIATPVLMFSNLHLRAVQATDASHAYRFTDYLRLRIVMTVAAMLAIAGIAWFGHYESRTTMVILAVALAKGVETLSDIHYGLFQLNDRLDHTGTSMILRGVAALVALSVALYLLRDVFWACVWLAIVWLGALLFFDIRRARGMPTFPSRDRQGAVRAASTIQPQWSLLRLALPLGIVTTIASINLNMPRYFIHAWMGEEELGVFSAMAYATVALTLISDSLGHCAIPRLSRLYAGGQIAEFRWLLLRLLAAGGVIGLAGLAIAEFMGARLLAVFYSPAYAIHSKVFTLLICAAAIHIVASMLTSGIISARRFRIQVPMFATVAAGSAWACYLWVPVHGLAGGAAAAVVGAVVRLVLAAGAVAYLLLAPANLTSGARSPHPDVDDWKHGV